MGKKAKETQFTAVQCKMARAGLGLGIRELAVAAECAPATIVRLEAGENLHKRTIKAIKETLEEAGAIFFITDDGNDGVAIQDEV